MSGQVKEAQSNSYLVNSYGKAPSRLSRTNPKQLYQENMPKKVSELSPSVIFQDADTVKNNFSGSEQKSNVQAKQSNKNTDKLESKKTNTLGLIGNAFMGATTKYQRVRTSDHTSTPTKNKTEDQLSTDKKSETNNQISATKFTRKKQSKQQAEVDHLPINEGHNAGKTPSITPRTDRSINQGKRIERKVQRGKVLKFMEKKDTDGSQTHQEQSKITKEASSHLTYQAETTIETENKPTKKQSEITPKQKLNSDRNDEVPKDQKKEIKKEVVNVVSSPNKEPIQRKSYQGRGRTPSEPWEPETKNTDIPSVSSSGVRPNRSSTYSESQQKEREKNEKEKVVLKKSSVSMLILRRLFAGRVRDSLMQLRFNSAMKQKHEKAERFLLLLSCQAIVNRKQSNLLNLALNRIKMKFSTTLIKEMKSNTEKSSVNPMNISLQLIQNLFIQRLRSSLQNMRRQLQTVNKIKSMTFIDSYEKKKNTLYLKDALEKIKFKAKKKSIALSNLIIISSNFVKSELKQYWLKLNLFHVDFRPDRKSSSFTPNRTPKSSFISRSQPSPSQPQLAIDKSLIQKQEKLRALNKSIQEGLHLLEKNLSQMKKCQVDTEKQYRQKISEQRSQNESIQNNLVYKKQFNEEMSKNILSIKKENNIEVELETEGSNKLQMLSNIYVTYHRSANQDINIDDLIAEYHLEDKDSQIGQEWSILSENLKMKQEIDRFEEVVWPQSKAKEALKKEKQMACNIVRSYVREQYFWQWLHVSVDNI